MENETADDILYSVLIMPKKLTLLMWMVSNNIWNEVVKPKIHSTRRLENLVSLRNKRKQKDDIYQGLDLNNKDALLKIHGI